MKKEEGDVIKLCLVWGKIDLYFSQVSRTWAYPVKLLRQANRIGIINVWHSLPQAELMVTGIDGFRRELNKFTWERSVDGYQPWGLD